MDRATSTTEHTVLDAPCGRLAGLRNGDVFAFRGIPYAEPPIGARHWRKPEPLPRWNGVRVATQFGPICPQAPTQFLGSLGRQSEDCLYLNVWPPGCDGGKRPVMVWIHGGAFVIGAGSQGLYDGRHLAARDCVVVTLNYRLGAFGFLNLSEIGGSNFTTGTEGIADQILALQWVKQNIATFGGDPGNIILFGESAGAMSIALLLSIPSARGLFHKAIAQSGAAHFGNSRARLTAVARAFLDQLGTGADADRLREAPTAALVKAQIAVLTNLRLGDRARNVSSVAFQPTIDGDLIPQRPIDALRAGSARDIPLLTGTTRDEWRLFSAASPRAWLRSRAAFAERVHGLVGDSAESFFTAYEAATPFDRFNALLTDKVFTIPAIRMLEAQVAFAPVYAYRFDWSSRFLGGLMGSCHALELGFVFGTYNTRFAGAFFGTGPAADSLADAMMESWTVFRTGNPTGRVTGPWPGYDATTREVMIFGDDEPHVVQAPNRARRLAWNDIPDSKIGA